MFFFTAHCHPCGKGEIDSFVCPVPCRWTGQIQAIGNQAQRRPSEVGERGSISYEGFCPGGAGAGPRKLAGVRAHLEEGWLGDANSLWGAYFIMQWKHDLWPSFVLPTPIITFFYLPPSSFFLPSAIITFLPTAIIIFLTHRHHHFSHPPPSSALPSALYYSYLYSKAFSRRTWRRFFAADPFDPKEGDRFRAEVLPGRLLSSSCMVSTPGKLSDGGGGWEVGDNFRGWEVGYRYENMEYGAFSTRLYIAPAVTVSIWPQERVGLYIGCQWSQLFLYNRISDADKSNNSTVYESRLLANQSWHQK